MRRGLIDYRMRRRALLSQVQAGEIGRHDVCDAHKELVRAGTHIGDPIDAPCPVCDGERLRQVTYVFTGKAAKGKGEGGSAIPTAKLPATILRHGDLKVWMVEVCLDCRWHHALESFWELRDGATAVGQQGR